MTEEKEPQFPPEEPREPRKRPQSLSGVTECVRTAHGEQYITVNFDEKGKPVEVLSHLPMEGGGGCEAAHNEAVSRLVSLALASGIEPKHVINELKKIICCLCWNEGELIKSPAGAVAFVLAKYTKKEESLLDS